MRKNVVVKLLTLLTCLIMLVGCSKTITLNLSFGEKTGKYEGDLVDGIPNGQGKFTSQNSEGQTWVYEGSFVNGHFEGEGKIYFPNTDYVVQTGTFSNDVLVALDEKESEGMFFNKDNFLGRKITAKGKVTAVVNREDNYVVYNMQQSDDYSSNKSFLVVYDNSVNIYENEYLEVKGIVIDSQDNNYGNAQFIPYIQVEEVQELSYIEVCAPTYKTIEVNDTYEQNGYAITVEKVELSEIETRVYVSVENKGSSEFNLYSFNTLIAQNGRQFDNQTNYSANYPQVQTGLRVGNKTEGILTFSPINDASFQLIIDARSGNYREKFDEYIFDINN